MKKILIPMLLVLGCLMSFNMTAQPAKNALTVSETLNLLKGKWRYMYKIIDGTIIYERSFAMGNRNAMGIDTNQVHTYTLNNLGRTSYFIDYQDPDGEIEVNEMQSSGSWDLQKISGAVIIVIRDAYFKGCPEIRRKIIRINKEQMLLEDVDTGDRFYFKRT